VTMGLLRVALVLGLVAGSGLLSACTTVSSLEPVGDQPRPALPADWEGTWVRQDHALVIRVADPQQGLLEVAWVEAKGGALRLEAYRVALRGAGDWTFGNVTEADQPGRSFWAALRRASGQIVLWLPDAERCAKLVREGVVPGTVEGGGDVVLGRLTPEQTLRLVSQDQGGCVDWSEPLLFARLGG